MKLELIDEFRIGRERARQIHWLLAASFPDCEYSQQRTYFKQLPSRRLLALDGERVVGHLALEHRVVATTTGPATIFGIIDLCVDPATRRQGTATRMLEHIEQLAIDSSIEFLMLFAQDRRLYERAGYRHASNPLRWLKIHEHQTYGIAEEPLDELMIKPATTRPWPGGLVDLLGYQF